MTRRSFLIGSGILVAWLVTIGFLVKNHYTGPTTTPAFTNESFFGSVEAVPRWQDIEEYMLIVQTDKNSGRRTIVGAAATEIRQVEDPSTTASYGANLQLEGKLSPILPKANVKLSGLLDKNVNLTEFHGLAKLGPISFEATGRMLNSLLYLKIVNSDNINLSRRRMEGPVSMAEAIRPTLGRQMEITPGSKMSAPVLDPLTGQNRGTLTVTVEEKEPIRVGDEEIEAYRVVSSIADIETVMWVDAEGRTLKRQLVGGLAMERTSREKALAQAPSLTETLEIPPLDPSEFEGVPITRDGDPKSGESTPGLGMLEALLK